MNQKLITLLTDTIAAVKRIGADYIVEQGTSGIWKYRKWKSGWAECWGTQIWNTGSISQWGSCYSSVYSPTVNYPFAFIENPKTYATLASTGVEGWLTNNRKETTSHTASYALIRPVNSGGNANMGINLYVVGKWKNPTGGGIAVKLHSLLNILSSRIKGVTV